MTRHQMLMSLLLKTARLPAEFQEVEWISSSGTQWIDTGVYTGTCSGIDVTLSLNVLEAKTITGAYYAQSWSTVDNTNVNVNGNNEIASTFRRNRVATTFNYGASDTALSAVVDTKYNTKIMFDTNAVNTYLNGTLTNTYAGINSPTYSQKIILFATRQQNGGTDYGGFGMANMRLYNAKYYDAGTLVRNFVPCYRKADGVIGLYDLVNGVFYTNAGTGTFTAGQEAN